MSAKDVFKDTMTAAIRNIGNVSGTMTEFRRLQAKRKWEARVGKWVVQHWLEEMNAEPRRRQYVDDDVRVEVKSGWDRRHRCVTTDILVIPRDGSNNHLHIVLDEQGNELHYRWTE